MNQETPIEEFSSNSRLPETAAGLPNLLDKKVKAYKQYYFLLMLTAAMILLLIALYGIAVYLANRNLYQAMDSKQEPGNTMAADSSGRMIALPVYNYTDSTLSIMVSTDSGRHFEQWGGPWKSPSTFNSIELIQSIGISPGNRSIVATSPNYFYIKAAMADSFTCISMFKFPNITDGNYSAGICFLPGTDSVYIYRSDGYIFCVHNTKYDSVSVARFSDIRTIDFLTVNEERKMLVAGRSYEPSYVNPGIFTDHYFATYNKYAVADYNYKHEPVADSTVAYPAAVMDSAMAIPMDTTVSKKMETLKK